MNRGLLAIDLDGTLLRSDLTVSEAHQKAVAKVLAKGWPVVLATGRTLLSTKLYTDLWPTGPLWIVGYNGAVTEPQRPGEPAPPPHLIPQQVAQEVAKWARAENLYMRTYIDDTAWAEVEMPGQAAFSQAVNVPFHLVDNLADELPGPVPKLIFLAEPEQLAYIEAQLTERWGDQLSVTSSGAEGLEIVAHGVSKAAALQELAERLGVSQAKSAAIGNARNDLEMIRWAGFGGAVGNSPDFVKEIADLVVADNDHDGVAQFIEAWLAKEAPV